MEYIKKEELKENDIYKANNGSFTYIMKATKNLENVKNIPEGGVFMKSGNFNGSHLTFTNATFEEKHWLNEAIRLDKFITFEEAMKTFIPEYVEWVDNIGSESLGYQTQYTFQKNKIFKTDIELPTAGFQTQDWKKHLEIYPNNYKPSTKEAYNAQFVVKEPEFIEYPIDTKVLNTQTDSVYIKKEDGWYKTSDKTSYTDEMITKSNHINIVEEIKIIEPLPQFKVIETIETITKVENNEGNQFFIGDKIKVSLNMVQKIISFSYNEDKTKIFANFNQNLSISINDIEHYIEPKNEK